MGNKANCFQCKYFYTTWNPAFPRGCKAYGFKTKEIPSVLVEKTTGSPCEAFQKKASQPASRKKSSSRFDIRL
ncbi:MULTISPECIES: uracil-DNA glycosylase [Pontibacillus]|uniref:Uracil-DNA glycosylase n=1 Tax=Pontibacillus chungwhensis TaxID=265426 RepID=A0ABY8UXK7_9BACI|nr:MULTISPECIES: uracil-DNA glycosylase [Pontibacillus]MCD5324004.1 uracil-DNA glycosylase [Pontibacillus sp. HN14]WIF97933.1 uracil-DNA glycosylase [Pontibacillus chungwhensis]